MFLIHLLLIPNKHCELALRAERFQKFHKVKPRITRDN
jgi:hypothetical protein